MECGWIRFAAGNIVTKVVGMNPRRPWRIAKVKAMTQDQEAGFDGNKKGKGRKRYILVHTLGLILAAVVMPANSVTAKDPKHWLRQGVRGR